MRYARSSSTHTSVQACRCLVSFLLTHNLEEHAGNQPRWLADAVMKSQEPQKVSYHGVSFEAGSHERDPLTQLVE